MPPKTDRQQNGRRTAPPHPNRVREWVRRTGLKLKDFHREMENVTGHRRDYSGLSKIQRGTRALTDDIRADILATLRHLGHELEPEDLDTPFAPPRSGLHEEISPWEPPGTHPLKKIKLPLQQFIWEMRVNILDEIGIHAGDLVIFDMSPKAFENLQPMDVVILQKYGQTARDTQTLVRQYIPPNLFITNSARNNRPALHYLRDDVQIKGVWVSVHRQNLHPSPGQNPLSPQKRDKK